MDQLQLLAILFSLLLIGYILWLIRSQRLKEEYSLLWLIAGGVFFVFSVWRQGLEVLGNALGIAYAPAALFIIILVGILLILIQFSMIITRLSDRSRIIAQEHALLQERVQELEERIMGQSSAHTEPDGGSADPVSGND